MTAEAHTKPFLSPWWMLYAIAVLGFPIFYLVNPIEPPEDFGHVAPFELTNQLNEPVNNTKLDQPLIINFIFTRCQNTCPTLTAKMAKLQETLDPKEARLLSITVDPTHDTPQVLQEYAKRFGADSNHWFFLTGEEKNIRQIIASFQQTYERIQNTEEVPNILHSEKFILLDQDSHIRGFFDADPEGLNLLIRSISAL